MAGAVEEGSRIHTVELRLDEQPVSVQPLFNADAFVKPNATYLVTGGLTGLGLETAKWLAAKGATQLLLVSRRGLRDPAVRAEIERLERQGCRVHVEAIDIADPDVVSAAVKSALAGLPPLRGVIHSAMVLKDGTLADLSAQDFKDVMRPKILGAWNLHQLTKEIPLDFFVLYSSVASVLGASMGAVVPQAVLLAFLGPLLILFVFLLGSGLLLSVVLPSARVAVAVGIAVHLVLFIVGATPIFALLTSSSPFLTEAIKWTPFAVASEGETQITEGGPVPWAHDVATLAIGAACLAAAWIVFRRKEVAQG